MEITPENILAAFGAIACIGGGVVYLSKFLHWLAHPNDVQNKKLQEHEALLKKHTEFLDKDNKKIVELEEQNHLETQALLVLIRHALYGNNIEEMKSCEKNIQDFLISK